MNIFYHTILLATKDEAFYRSTLEKLKKAQIKCKINIVTDQYLATHTSTASGSEVLGRSVKPIKPSLGSQRIYEIYVKPKDAEAAKRLINNSD